VQVDTRTNALVYTGFQFGNYFRIHQETGDTTPIQPQHDLGERPYRFNWQTPIHLSRHNQDILYLGSQYLHRSLDQGDTWEKLSPDLTGGGRAGDVPYGTLTDIDESPFRFGTLYVGTDDGRIHVTRDGGEEWTRIDDGLPQNLWVSRVVASHHAEGRVYASLNGYRWDHFDAYVYRSDDYGATWTRLGPDLPTEPVNVVREDPANEDVLYVGTDHGLYVSLDRGASFMAMRDGLPAAPVHDLKVHPRENDLLVGTHGRSIYRANVAHVQALTPEMQERPLHAFAIDSLRYNDGWGTRRAVWAEVDTASVTIPFYASEGGTATLTVRLEDGPRVQRFTRAADRGLNYAAYDLSADPDQLDAINRHVEQQDDDAEPWEASDNAVPYLRPGTYTLELALNGTTETTTLTVQPPPERRSAEPRMEGGVPGPSEEEETK